MISLKYEKYYVFVNIERGFKSKIKINLKKKGEAAGKAKGRHEIEDEDEEEVHPPGLPRRPASEIHLRPKPDHRLSDWTGVCSTLRSFRPGREETGGESAAVALHEGVTENR